MRQQKPTKEINIGKPAETATKKGLEAKFDQLVKEVDQCFGELGRQMQRETKVGVNTRISIPFKNPAFFTTKNIFIEKRSCII